MRVLAKACNFLLTLAQIFLTSLSKPSILSKFIPNSFLSWLLLMTLSILIEKGSSLLKMRWHLSAFVFKILFEKHLLHELITFFGCTRGENIMWVTWRCLLSRKVWWVVRIGSFCKKFYRPECTKWGTTLKWILTNFK